MEGTCEYMSVQGTCEYMSVEGTCEYMSVEGTCEYTIVEGTCEYVSADGTTVTTTMRVQDKGLSLMLKPLKLETRHFSVTPHYSTTDTVTCAKTYII